MTNAYNEINKQTKTMNPQTKNGYNEIKVITKKTTTTPRQQEPEDRSDHAINENNKPASIAHDKIPPHEKLLWTYMV
jgi:hypothetical protein